MFVEVFSVHLTPTNHPKRPLHLLLRPLANILLEKSISKFISISGVGGKVAQRHESILQFFDMFHQILFLSILLSPGFLNSFVVPLPRVTLVHKIFAILAICASIWRKGGWILPRKHDSTFQWNLEISKHIHQTCGEGFVHEEYFILQKFFQLFVVLHLFLGILSKCSRSKLGLLFLLLTFDFVLRPFVCSIFFVDFRRQCGRFRWFVNTIVNNNDLPSLRNASSIGSR